jgi:PKD repeat protein
MEVVKKMKGRKKIFISILISAIIICSTYVIAIEYQFFGDDYTEEEIFPLVKIFTDYNSGAIPFEVNFTSLVLYQTGDVEYSWDFGDNKTSNEVYPLHTYNQTGIYECTLTVTDSAGKQSSDKVKIFVRENEAPIVSITMSDLKPNRPFIPIIRRQSISLFYYGQRFRRIIDWRYFPKSLLNIEGFVSCEATALSPEGNDIVSYKWELRAPTYNKIGGTPVKPVYILEGQNITIPLLLIYPADVEYDLTSIVTDSKGLIGTSTIKFEVQLDPLEDQILTIKENIKTFRRDVWHDVLKGFLGQPIGNVIFDLTFPLLKGLPMTKLIVIFRLLRNWGIEPNDGAIVGSLAKFLDKHSYISNFVESFFNKIISILNNRKQKSPNLEKIIDGVIQELEKLLESLGLQNKRPILSNESPEDGSRHLSTNYPEVAITVEDPENDTFNITIHGKYVNNITYHNQVNDTFIATLKTPLPNLTDIKWNVNVSYSQNKWINETYQFSTW